MVSPSSRDRSGNSGHSQGPQASGQAGPAAGDTERGRTPRCPGHDKGTPRRRAGTARAEPRLRGLVAGGRSSSRPGLLESAGAGPARGLPLAICRDRG